MNLEPTSEIDAG